MEKITAAKFKDQCLKIMDRVAATRDPIVVTKRGRPVVTVVPFAEAVEPAGTLKGSIVKERGSPYRTGEDWDADHS